MTTSRGAFKGYLVTMILVLGSGCSEQQTSSAGLDRLDTAPRALVAAQPLKGGSSVVKLVARWPKRTPGEVAQRMKSLGTSLLAGRGALDNVGLQAALLKFRPDAEFWAFDNGNVDGRSRLHFTYHVKSDDLRVEDVGLLEQISPGEIDEATARSLMKEAVGRLVAAGLVRAEDYDPTGASLAWRRIGEGRKDENVVDKILEYRFSLLRQINGVPFANAGIRVGVHRTGTVSSLRVGGAEILSVRQGGLETPTDARGGVVTRVVARADIALRFGQEFPNAKIWTQGLMYAMRDDVEEDVIEPKEHFLFTRVSESPDGTKVFAPGERVSYSTTEVGAPPTVHNRTVSAPVRAPDVR